MSFKALAKGGSFAYLLCLTLTGCFFHPPYNNFTKRSPDLTPLAIGASVGAAGAAAASGGAAVPIIIGASTGFASGTALATYQKSEQVIIKALQKADIQYVRYGETRLLIVPTDHYFIINTARLDDLHYEGLNNIVNLLRLYPHSTIYVAGFTDNVGTRVHKRRLSEAQSETMLGFLWANNIKSNLLHGEGHGDRHAIADNHLIHGSALNRRIEIEWRTEPTVPFRAPLSGAMK